MTFPRPFYRWRPHPCHGLEVGPNPPTIVHSYIEITPFDPVKYEVDDISKLPNVLVERLTHYFLTYKMLPDIDPKVFIGEAYGKKHAEKVIEAAIKDYQEEFGEN